ncbi:MAG: Hsp20/alpha crystallin family protein [Candidatus Altiarchaeia archaeon]
MEKDPFEDIKRMQEEIDESSDAFFGRGMRRPMLPAETEKRDTYLAPREPLMDLVDEKDQYKVIIEVPGINKEDIDISVTEDSVTVKTETKTGQEKEEKGYYYQERRYESFQKSFSLPGEVLPDSASAEYKNGVLEIKMKKKQDARTKEHKVKVK